MDTLKLRYVTTANFNASEEAIFRAVLLKRPELKNTLAINEVVCVRSKRGDQVMFIYGWMPIDGTNGEHLYALRSERLRLDKRRTWNPLMLANYAHQVGIKLEGIKTFEQHLGDLTKSLAKAFTVVLRKEVEKTRRKR